MVAILVLLTIVGFVLADWICQVVAARRVRRAIHREASQLVREHRIRA